MEVFEEKAAKIALFPLPNVVLFPGMELPLHIFEERYRIMIDRALAENLHFGVLLCKTFNPGTLEGSPFDVGTAVEIRDLERLPDNRFNLVTLGTRRFTVDAFDKTEPYLQAEVRWIKDDPTTTASPTLVKQTKVLFHEAMRLTHKIHQKEFAEPEFPKSPEYLSYYVAENLKGSLVLKQELLEIVSTKERLLREKAILSDIVKTLAVQAQIEEAFR